uniref:Uncharacterized protein n=1 Tax=viral metagenome TaxID=1070528 RepID=A0A6C0CY84_9ZZZZ
MYKSRSSPSLTTIIECDVEEEDNTFKKSNSSPEFIKKNIYKIRGEGELGIELSKKDNKAVIVNILEGSYAYKKIPINLINLYYIYRVNDFEITTFDCILKYINLIWKRDNEIVLEFKEFKEFSNADKKLDKFYKDNKLHEYIKLFNDIGVRTFEDLKFLELQDFKTMNIPGEIIVNICKYIGIEIPKSIYLTKFMSTKEKQKIITDNSTKDVIIYIQSDDGWLCI